MIDWTHMNPEVQPLYNSLVDQFGMPLPITSGFRDPAHNAKVGGAKGSQHLHGNALDIDASNLSQAQRLALISLAREQGFGGVGVYDNSLHFDVGDTRAWGPDYTSASIPEWARDAVSMGAGNVATDPNNSNDGIAALDAFEMPASARWGRALGNIGDRLVAYGRREALPQQLSGDRMYDRQFAKKSRNHTAQWLQTNGYGDLANMVLAGQMSGKDAIAAIYGKGGGGGLDPNQQLTQANSIIDDYRKEGETFRQVEYAFNSVQNAFTMPQSNASDYALAVAFAKLVDPGSVAREGEVAAVANSGGVIPGFQMFWDRVIGGGTLPPEVRQTLYDLSAQAYDTQYDSISKKYSHYNNILQQSGLPGYFMPPMPERLSPPTTQPPTTQPPTKTPTETPPSLTPPPF